MINGYATSKSTSHYSKRFDLPYRQSEIFTASAIALGTHLGEMNEIDSLRYREGLEYGILNGINFIDTAINYRGMRSERDVGHVLESLINKKKTLKREEVIISSKAGIIPGDVVENLVPKDYLQKVLLDRDIIKESDLNVIEHHKHVLTPSYYLFAIEQSKQHLNLNTIDIYYVHNPEISMMVLGPEIFYEHLERLFLHLEDQVQQGNIRYYGLATWSAFLKSPQEEGYISIEEVVNRAKSVAGNDHHFQFIQFPLNKQMSQSISLKNQRVHKRWCTLLEAAVEMSLYLTTSAPFQLGKIFKKEENPQKALLDITRNHAIFSTMVGMKQVKHIRKNIEWIQGEVCQ